jgi:uncharacterized membrane protein
VRPTLWLGLVMVIVAVLVGVHQYVTIGAFFQLQDARHHEFLMALFGAFGLGVLFGSIVSPRERKGVGI